MSLCEPIRREIEEEEAVYLGLAGANSSHLKAIMEHALGLRYVRWVAQGGECEYLVELWRKLKDCEKEAFEQLKQQQHDKIN